MTYDDTHLAHIGMGDLEGGDTGVEGTGAGEAGVGFTYDRDGGWVLEKGDSAAQGTQDTQGIKGTDGGTASVTAKKGAEVTFTATGESDVF